MDTFHDALSMRNRSRDWRSAGLRVALVPTMGALHRGHLDLVRLAQAKADKIVMSVFVNPIQFDRQADLESYPRTLESDCEAAREAGVEAIFAPNAAEMYPPGFQTFVDVEEVSRTLCGATRPGHFRGVATVVLKLFNIVEPDVAVFGWKDAQQFILLRRMVSDLNLPIEMVGRETVREEDGLALSSRNKLLTSEQRAEAPALQRGLRKIVKAVQAGETESAALLAIGRAEIEASGAFRIDYLEMVSIDRVEPVTRVEPGNTMVAAAAFIGDVRLIDNVRL